MIFADKLIQLRKKSGWSQEELAEQMNVSRQAVSKWEGAQSIPDLDKIVKLSELFGVSTDYLLKDEIEQTEALPTEEDSGVRRVGMEEADAFIKATRYTAGKIAAGGSLCIISPICLIFLSVLSETKGIITEGAASGIGLCVLMVIIAIAVAVFIFCGSKVADYEYLEKEVFDTEYGVDGMVRQRRQEFHDKYTMSNIVGTCLCIASVIPIFAGIMINEDDDLLISGMVCLMLIIVSIGTFVLVKAGTVWGCFDKLLQAGDYTPEKKSGKASLSSVFTTVYWLAATAVLLTVSFTRNDWGHTWIIMAVAGVLFPALLAVVRFIESKLENKK